VIDSPVPMQPNNFHEPYIEGLLASIGLTDVHTIEIEGVAHGEKSFDLFDGSPVHRFANG
jgi:FMN-dependent NADH-azoreductase